MMSKHGRAFVPLFFAGASVVLSMHAQGGYWGSAWGDTFYVSPTGSDSNSGTSPNSAWATLGKVDSTAFSAGSQILFQAGGNWYGQLVASSSGAVGNPIVYGSYGSGPNPTFWGSDLTPGSSFTPSGTPDVYTAPQPVAVNSFLIDHQFARSAMQNTHSADPTTNLNFLNSTPDSWYQNGNTLYINTGSASAPSNSDGHVYTTAVRDSVVLSIGHSNVTFQNMTVKESAKDQAGYGFDMEQGSNLSVLNSTAVATGKHAFAAIDVTNFLGKNLNASYSLPDQGYGGASAFVTYTDHNFAGTSSQWINLNYTNSNGPYQGFITHEDTAGAISSVLVQNLNTTGAPAVSLYSAPGETAERIKIVGGHMNGGDIQVYSSNTVIDGVLLTGGGGTIALYGDNNTLQNSIISGALPDWRGGRNGAIILAGQNNVVRFNTVDISNAGSGGANLGLMKADPNAADSAQNYGQVYGNIFKTGYGAVFQNFAGAPTIQMADNLFTGSSNPQAIYFYDIVAPTQISQWLAAIASNSFVGNAQFAGETAGDVFLMSTPTGIESIPLDSPLGEALFVQLYGNAASSGSDVNTASLPEPASIAVVALTGICLARRPKRRRG